MSEGKRYSVVLHVANDSPFRQTGDSCTRPIRTDVVLATDYAALEAERDALRQQRDKLAGLLREAKSAYTTATHWTDMRATMAKIDVALSELTP